MFTAFITWDVDPELFNLFGREIRWYGLLWATGILMTSMVALAVIVPPFAGHIM